MIIIEINISMLKYGSISLSHIDNVSFLCIIGYDIGQIKYKL